MSSGLDGTLTRILPELGRHAEGAEAEGSMPTGERNRATLSVGDEHLEGATDEQEDCHLNADGKTMENSLTTSKRHHPRTWTSAARTWTTATENSESKTETRWRMPRSLGMHHGPDEPFSCRRWVARAQVWCESAQSPAEQHGQGGLYLLFFFSLEETILLLLGLKEETLSLSLALALALALLLCFALLWGSSLSLSFFLSFVRAWGEPPLL